MASHTIFIEPNILSSAKYSARIIDFCLSFCNQITFGTHLAYYELSMQEYDVACNEFLQYYRNEDTKRRIKFENDLEYKHAVMGQQSKSNNITKYFDRLHQYDLVEFTEIKKSLAHYIHNSTDRLPKSTGYRKDKRSTASSLPTEAFTKVRFTFSHCTTGAPYRVYYFGITPALKHHLLTEGNLLNYYSYHGIELEDPAFYSDDSLILSVCTHERLTALYLSEAHWKAFQQLEIPYKK